MSVTKSEEIEHLKKFCEGLPPDWYLADFMAGAVESFANMVRQDLSFPTLAQTAKDRVAFAIEAGEERRRLASEIEARKRDLVALEVRVRELKSGLTEVYDLANAIRVIGEKTANECASLRRQ